LASNKFQKGIFTIKYSIWDLSLIEKIDTEYHAGSFFCDFIENQIWDEICMEKIVLKHHYGVSPKKKKKQITMVQVTTFNDVFVS
jgi:hypothetical protein